MASQISCIRTRLNSSRLDSWLDSRLSFCLSPLWWTGISSRVERAEELWQGRLSGSYEELQNRSMYWEDKRISAFIPAMKLALDSKLSISSALLNRFPRLYMAALRILLYRRLLYVVYIWIGRVFWKTCGLPLFYLLLFFFSDQTWTKNLLYSSCFALSCFVECFGRILKLHCSTLCLVFLTLLLPNLVSFSSFCCFRFCKEFWWCSVPA